MVARGQRWGKGTDCKEDEVAFWGKGNVLYHNCWVVKQLYTIVKTQN